MKSALVILLTIVFGNIKLQAQQGQIYAVKSGKIAFQSEAPFETIKASSNKLVGLLDVQKKQFAFRVKMESFDGFNSALQKEHFNENYIESTVYPEASFTGKIIEDVDLTKDGTYTVRTKGNFTIHGMSQERIIKSDVVTKDGKINIKAAFTVLLADHNIPIPKVVKDKLSSEINVLVSCQLEPRQ
jgi:hypothetical protein